MVGGKALRGLGKALLKKTRPKYLKKISRGTPTKAAFIARRNQLRGASITDKFKKPIPEGVKAIKKSGAIDFTSGAGAGLITGYLLGKRKDKKEAKAMEAKEKKAEKDLKKAIEKHKKLDRERKKKQADKKTNKKYYKGK